MQLTGACITDRYGAKSYYHVYRPIYLGHFDFKQSLNRNYEFQFYCSDSGLLSELTFQIGVSGERWNDWCCFVGWKVRLWLFPERLSARHWSRQLHDKQFHNQSDFLYATDRQTRTWSVCIKFMWQQHQNVGTYGVYMVCSQVICAKYLSDFIKISLKLATIENYIFAQSNYLDDSIRLEW